jgi:penicillin-binding protein A
VMRAASGEILALISEPTFDPATLETDYEKLSHDPAAPLLNRATQGLYAPGRMLLPFFAAEAIDRNLIADGSQLCSAPVSDWIAADPDFPGLVLSSFRFDRDPAMELPTANVPALAFPTDPVRVQIELNGQGAVLVSPIQLALAFSSIAAGGMAPAPRLVAGLESPAGWIVPDPISHPVAMVSAETAGRVRELLLQTGIGSEWFGCNQTRTEGGISWYAGFQTAGDDPIVVVVAVEGFPADAIEIGRYFLASADGIE